MSGYAGDDWPIPTLPPVIYVPMPPVTANNDLGLVVPMPTLPALSTIRLVLVVDPTANWACPGRPCMENIAYGVEVPTHTLGRPPDDPTDSRGVATMPVPALLVVEVAMLQALKMLERMVLVAEPRYAMVVDAAVEEEILM